MRPNGLPIASSQGRQKARRSEQEKYAHRQAIDRGQRGNHNLKARQARTDAEKANRHRGHHRIHYQKSRDKHRQADKTENADRITVRLQVEG